MTSSLGSSQVLAGGGQLGQGLPGALDVVDVDRLASDLGNRLGVVNLDLNLGQCVGVGKLPGAGVVATGIVGHAVNAIDGTIEKCLGATLG
jgi:hypothetical protein